MVIQCVRNKRFSTVRSDVHIDRRFTTRNATINFSGYQIDYQYQIVVGARCQQMLFIRAQTGVNDLFNPQIREMLFHL